MQVQDNSVVSLHYTLTGEDGERIESSRDHGEPIHALIGHGGLIPGMENALRGHQAGDRFEVKLAPAEAYGERRNEPPQRIAKKYFHQAQRLRPGMVTTLNLKDGGQRQVVVVKVGSSVIDVDLNHPLAGRTLVFDIEIIDVRAATEEEIAHRHVHGPGGVHHH